MNLLRKGDLDGKLFGTRGLLSSTALLYAIVPRVASFFICFSDEIRPTNFNGRIIRDGEYTILVGVKSLRQANLENQLPDMMQVATRTIQAEYSFVACARVQKGIAIVTTLEYCSMKQSSRAALDPLGMTN